MKIAFDVDVLAKQMSIADMVYQVADWIGDTAILNNLLIPELIRSINIRCSLGNAKKNTVRHYNVRDWKFLHLLWFTVGRGRRKNNVNTR